MLNPHDGGPCASRLLDEAPDIRNDGVALVSSPDNAILHVDDEECCVRTVLQRGHGPSLLIWAPVLHRSNRLLHGRPQANSAAESLDPATLPRRRSNRKWHETPGRVGTVGMTPMCQRLGMCQR